MKNEQSDSRQGEEDDERFELEPPARTTQTMGILADTVNAEILDNSVNQRSYYIFRKKKEPVKSIWTVNRPIRDFRGRHELLQKIHQKLQKCSNSVDYWQDRALVLVGFGGMGKSELSRKFASDHRAQYPSAAWIQAETEESIKTSFFKLAELLGLRVKKETSGKEIAKLVFRHVGKHIPSTLFIYDNANGLKSTADTHGIHEYLPSGVYDYLPLVLITSQTTTDWKLDRIKVVSVTELTQTESMEFLSLRFGLSEERLSNDQRLTALIHELSACLQGYPLGLQLAAANIKYIADEDPMSSLHENLKDFTSMFKGGIDRKLLDKTADAATDYPRTFSVIWDITMKRLSSEKCVSPALHLLRILAYWNPDRTEMNELQQIYNVSVSQEDKIFGDETFDLALKKLEQLSIVSRYSKGWAIMRDTYLRMHRIVQKLIRSDDTDGLGLQSILLADKPLIALNYMTVEPVLTIPPSVMQDERLSSRWLQCFGYALRQDHNFPFNTTVRLQVNSASEEKLRSTGNGTGEETLAALEFIRKVETEKDVGALYLASVDYAVKHPASALHHVAEFCAFKCWTSQPFSCNPSIYRLFKWITIVHFGIASLSANLLCFRCVDVYNGNLTWVGAAFTAIVLIAIFLCLFRFPSSYFWFRTVVGMKNGFGFRCLVYGFSAGSRIASGGDLPREIPSFSCPQLLSCCRTILLQDVP